MQGKFEHLLTEFQDTQAEFEHLQAEFQDMQVEFEHLQAEFKDIRVNSKKAEFNDFKLSFINNTVLLNQAIKLWKAKKPLTRKNNLVQRFKCEIH